jgi:hypothetical protein
MFERLIDWVIRRCGSVFNKAKAKLEGKGPRERPRPFWEG